MQIKELAKKARAGFEFNDALDWGEITSWSYEAEGDARMPAIEALLESLRVDDTFSATFVVEALDLVIASTTDEDSPLWGPHLYSALRAARPGELLDWLYMEPSSLDLVNRVLREQKLEGDHILQDALALAQLLQKYEVMREVINALREVEANG